MSLVFPLTRAAFFDLLPVQEFYLDVEHPVQITGLGGGEILQAEVAPPYWRGRVSLAPMRQKDGDAIRGLLSALAVPGRRFHVGDPHCIGPAADPLGAGLAGYTPVVEARNNTYSTLRISGLPPGYELRPGDHVQVMRDGDPERPDIYRLLEGATANGAGITPGSPTGGFQVTPHLRTGAADLSSAVGLLRPYMDAVLVPGSVSGGINRNRKAYGISFEFRQALR